MTKGSALSVTHGDWKLKKTGRLIYIWRDLKRLLKIDELIVDLMMGSLKKSWKESGVLVWGFFSIGLLVANF